MKKCLLITCLLLSGCSIKFGGDYAGGQKKYCFPCIEKTGYGGIGFIVTKRRFVLGYKYGDHSDFHPKWLYGNPK